jgi:hypothetical protein
MIYTDLKYVNLISSRLPRFKRKSGNTFSCRCPVCGDSKTDMTKARGYLYEKKGSMLYFCHNCGVSLSLVNLLKFLDPILHKEYCQETFVEKYGERERVQINDFITPQPKFVKNSPLNSLSKISQLTADHPAKQYVVNRKIPPEVHYKLFYAPRFKQWVNTLVPGKLPSDDKDEARLILPFLDKEKRCYGFQGRAFGKSSIRYITIMLDDSQPKVFGLDTVDSSKRVYVTEGPIDSLFLPNAIAMAGSDSSVGWSNKDFTDVVYVYDNEPRNKEIVQKMHKAALNGAKIVVWPMHVEQKDINDMILSGMSKDGLKKLVDDCTYEGLAAELAISHWSKV